MTGTTQGKSFTLGPDGQPDYNFTHTSRINQNQGPNVNVFHVGSSGSRGLTADDPWHVAMNLGTNKAIEGIVAHAIIEFLKPLIGFVTESTTSALNPNKRADPEYQRTLVKILSADCSDLADGKDVKAVYYEFLGKMNEKPEDPHYPDVFRTILKCKTEIQRNSRTQELGKGLEYLANTMPNPIPGIKNKAE